MCSGVALVARAAPQRGREELRSNLLFIVAIIGGLTTEVRSSVER